MTPYRTRKVRILNGAHTSSVPAAFLYGLETVGEMMDHQVLGKYVRQVIYDEIIPSIDLDKDMLTEFADSVVERFQTPLYKALFDKYIAQLIIKIQTRTPVHYRASTIAQQVSKGSPSGSFDCRIKMARLEGSDMKAYREKASLIMKDDLWALEFLLRKPGRI